MILPLAAVAAPTATDAGVWSSVTVQADLHEGAPRGPRLWLDLHARRSDANFLAIARPALGYDVTKGLGLFAGYAWVPSGGDSTDGALFQEHRLWQQALLQHAGDGVSLAFRPRLEERFAHDAPGVGLRVRLWGRAGVAVSRAVTLVATDEVFVGLGATEWGAVAGFDQNRLFLGPALPIEGVGRVEFGYLDVFLLRESGNTVLHLASANLFVNL